ncbi:MAG: class I tRNA ligase family protein, partial [Planctomycetota bacterium]
MGEVPLAKSYVPAEHEPAILQRWADARCFHAEVGAAGEPYSIFIPPPNVTAALHLGHALNNTLQDVLARTARMRGRNTLWMPGTDHAGIATQAVVERRLQMQGKRRTDFTREEFVAKVQAWKDEYESVILSQLRSMGASCDEARTRFTMDPVCTAAVREAFFRLFQEGLIERGKRLVNWDPVTQTALSDDEVEMEEVDGSFWYLRYPLEDGTGHITVATTRPETMLGDTAVAVHPRDPRAAALRGKRIRLPIVGRVIPIVEDEYVVMAVAQGGDPADVKAQFATGFLKVTPAHDPNDWEIGMRHQLPAINVMAPDGSISDRHGWSDVSAEARPFVGLSREEARDRIVQHFRSAGLLEGVRPYRHSVGHASRSHVPVEPYLSDQWFVRVTDPRLAGSALRAMRKDQRQSESPSAAPARAGDGELAFYPARYARTFEQWHVGIRDWCISRQLWWGHRIPV